MVFVQCAAEAEVVSAFAVYARYNLLQLSLLDVAIYGVHAVWRWAPLEVLEVVDIRSS